MLDRLGQKNYEGQNMGTFSFEKLYSDFKDVILPDINGDGIIDKVDWKSYGKLFGSIYGGFLTVLYALFGEKNIAKLLDYWYYVVLFGIVALVITIFALWVKNINNKNKTENQRLKTIIQTQAKKFMDFINDTQVKDYGHQLELLELNARNNITAELAKFGLKLNNTEEEKLINAVKVLTIEKIEEVKKDLPPPETKPL
jgi:hypothetical protein